MYTSYSDTGMLFHRNGKFTMENLYLKYWFNQPSLAIANFKSVYEAMKQT